MSLGKITKAAHANWKQCKLFKVCRIQSDGPLPHSPGGKVTTVSNLIDALTEYMNYILSKMESC